MSRLLLAVGLCGCCAAYAPIGRPRPRRGLVVRRAEDRAEQIKKLNDMFYGTSTTTTDPDASTDAASAPRRAHELKLAVDPALEYATFASVDVEEADELLVQARNVEALPTYQLVQNGRLLLQFTGSDDVKLKMETIRFGRGLGLSTQKHRLAR